MHQDTDRARGSAPPFATGAAAPFYPIKNRRSLRSRIGTLSSDRSKLSWRIWQLTVTTWTVSQAWQIITNHRTDEKSTIHFINSLEGDILLWSNWKVNFKFKLPGIFETEIFFHKLVVLLVTSVPNFTSKYSLVFELRFFLWGIKI